MAFDLEELYRTTYDAVVRFLYRKVWDADRAEDLAQEVFMRALAHQPEKPRSWVFAVAANIARDEARAAIRRRKHLVLLTHEPIAAPSSPSVDVEEELDREQQENEIKLALAALSPRDREVLLLWDAGLSYPEIADQTHLAVGAVGTTLARARKRLVAAHDEIEAGRHMPQPRVVGGAGVTVGGRPHIPEEELHAFCDGELSPSQRTEIAEHLLACLICRANHGEVSDLRARATSLLSMAAPKVARRRAVPQTRAWVQALGGRRGRIAAAGLMIVGLGTWMAIQSPDLGTPIPRLATAFVTPALFARPENVLPLPTPKDASLARRMVLVAKTSASPTVVVPASMTLARKARIAEPAAELDPAIGEGWEATTWDAAVKASSGLLARLEGLPVTTVRQHKSLAGGRPTFLIRHQLPDGRALWVLEGPVDEIGAMEHLLEAAGLTTSMSLRARPDYVNTESATVRTTRMVTIAGYLPSDSLDALTGKLTQKE